MFKCNLLIILLVNRVLFYIQTMKNRNFFRSKIRKKCQKVDVTQYFKVDILMSRRRPKMPFRYVLQILIIYLMSKFQIDWQLHSPIATLTCVRNSHVAKRNNKFNTNLDTTRVKLLRYQTSLSSEVQVNFNSIFLTKNLNQGIVDKYSIISTKGQLISKCPFGVIVWTKIQTKNFLGFLPQPLQRF